MIDKAQSEIAKNMWEQSRAAAMQAHQAWDMVMKSQKTMMDSMRGMGAPFAMAADQYDKLMDFHSQQYKAAVAYMEKMSDDYRKMVEQQQKK